MKYTKLSLLVVLLLVSCAEPATPAPTQAFTQEPTALISTVDVSNTAPIPMTMDPALGNIEGSISWLDPIKSAKVPIHNVNI